jgi:hypothetical protein
LEEKILRIFRIEEPELYFNGNQRCLDPQVGLLKFGPHGGVDAMVEKPKTIIAGIIGTTKIIDETIEWLERLKYRINAEETKNTEYKGIDFPGINKEGPLNFEITIDKNCILRIDKKFIKELSKIISRKERIIITVNEYCKKFDDMLEADPKPHIILLPIDDDLMRLCKEPGIKIDKIKYERREFGDPDNLNAPLFDFHNYLKAQAAIRGFVTQMISPRTIKFSEDKQSPAFIGWNFAVGIYYKATGIPWKLADIDEDTCYIGISFYQEIGESNKSMRASIAQVYMRTGESQVIRGNVFDWDEKISGKQVHLNSNQIEKIAKDSIEIYVRQRKEFPRRVVIHKSTYFTDEELKGCESACENIDELDIIHVRDKTGFRAFHDEYGYPVLRGTVIANEKEVILFTSGYVPALATYPGPTVPAPLHLIIQKMDTSIETICQDILSLTKLDWNVSTFYTRSPVTIGVSRKVGAVMAEMTNLTKEPPTSYKYYM